MSKIKDFLKSPLGTALCAAAACLLAVVLVWLAAVRPNNDKSLSERISDDYSQYSAELDEANGAAQTFDTDNDLLAMAFVFGTSNGQPTGELHLELADADTGEVLARSTGDMANIVAGQYTGMGLDTPVTGSADRRYRVTLKPEYTGSGRLTVGCSNGAVLWNDTFTVNGEAVDGTLALLVTYKQIGGFLTRFFLLVGLLASVVVFLGIYFAMRGRMPLHRLVFVLVLILLYIALRFKNIGGLTGGMMAVLALVNDLMVVFGTFVLLRTALDGNFIAAMLTILGYSINDTVVVYDRIRENRALMGKKGSFEELVNQSVNQSARRTLITTITTVMALGVMCIVAKLYGLDSIFTFAFPLMMGMISGVYTSLCVSTSAWVLWSERSKKKN